MPVTRVPNGAHDDHQAMNFGVSVTGYKSLLKRALGQAYSSLSFIIIDCRLLFVQPDNQGNLF